MLSAVEWTERDVVLYRAVAKARELIRDGVDPSDAAPIACDEYGTNYFIKVRDLAVAAEKACAAAREWIRENVK